MQQLIISRERERGTYHISAFYLARLTAEMPLAIIKPIGSVTIVFAMAGVQSVAAFFIHLGAVLLGAFNAQSMGSLLTACILPIDRCMIASMIAFLAQLLLGGFYVQRMPVWISWCRYLCPSTYIFAIMLGNDLADGRTFLCKTENSAFHHCTQTGNWSNGTAFIPRQDILDIYNIHLPDWASVLVLLLFLIFFHTSAYIVLRTFRKP
ncbi:uncharacterized protein LOC132386195 [Hypanus sabinus]|uniref:uncharacterized protein LOC132386195 n=1 Tax=Hypanus sabinus TaxID=79690 RepID=UPI0028C3D931|nr:uncharacterized protein LOC132386195 [Hypanus sabinus]